MNRDDIRAWQSARTLADLGDLTARWIEGTIGEQPWYRGPCDIEDPDTLIPVLSALNRAGYVTTASSAGVSGTGYDGARWQQRAAVEGFAGPDMTRRIGVAAYRAGMTVITFDPAALPRRHWVTDRQVPVTLDSDGEEYTWFGQSWPRREIRSRRLGWGICHRAAVTALCDAWQVTVADPEWGRPGLLWAVLAEVAAGAA